MRPGSRLNGEPANPIAAAIYGAVVALLVGYALSYLFTCQGMGVVSGHCSWHSRDAFTLAGLNLYASQHVPLLGAGVPPGDEQSIRAFITMPLTLWAAIPIFALMAGGWISARARVGAGRWGMTASALMGGIIYAGVLAGAAGLTSSRFEFTAMPAIKGFELIPPDIPFRPSLTGAVRYGLLFGLAFSYLGALIAVRSGAETHVRGKWWACAKSVIVVALLVQLFLCGGIIAWFAAQSRDDSAAELAQPEVIQIVPTAAGISYALMHAAIFSAKATPLMMPSAGYGLELELYNGVKIHDAGKTKSRPASPYVWIAAVIGGLAAFMSGRYAVKLGSRDGSLPTAARITVLQSAYLAVVMILCRMAWGIEVQSSVTMGAVYDPAMLIQAACVFALSLLGAHLANRRFAGRLSGFPSV